MNTTTHHTDPAADGERGARADNNLHAERRRFLDAVERIGNDDADDRIKTTRGDDGRVRVYQGDVLMLSTAYMDEAERFAANLRKEVTS